MQTLLKTGRLLYGLGIAAAGIHQLIIRQFRPEILPPFPPWANQHAVFPIIAGIALAAAGLVITGLTTVNSRIVKSTCLYLGAALLAVILLCHLPSLFLVNPPKSYRLDVWFPAAEELAFCGGAFIMAGSFRERTGSILEKLVPAGPAFFSVLMILFGVSHFVFTDFVSTMVPKFFGSPVAWTWFTGSALIAAGIAITLRIWMRQVALLLAAMLFIFFIFFHIPDAVAHPSEGGGKEIVRALIDLLFIGIALVTAYSSPQKTN